MFWTRSKDEEIPEEASQAFETPSQIGQRFRRPLSPAHRDRIAQSASKETFAISRVNTNEDKRQLDDMFGATGVVMKRRNSGKLGSADLSPLDLRTNDNSFHAIAKNVVERFQSKLTAKSIRVTFEDRMQVDQMVPKNVRASFIDAVRYRLLSCPSDSTDPIHVLTRECQSLGLDREGDRNLLLAPPGTKIDFTSGYSLQEELSKMQEEVHKMASVDNDTADSPAKQQLLAELREASNLLAESVTPEASQFWRNHVSELQARLKALDEGNTKENTNTGYFSPNNQGLNVGESRGLEIDPKLASNPVVDVVAPDDLPGGYSFEAEMGTQRFLATVPAGGVRRGETFSTHMKKIDIEIPVGLWRDGLFSCFKHGVCHPLVVNTIACPLLGLSQIMTRLELDFMGSPGKNIPKSGIFSTRGLVFTVILFWLFLNAFVLIGLQVKVANHVRLTSADKFSFLLINVAMLCYTWYAVSTTRKSIREKYLIETGQCTDIEDGLNAAFCMPCTICQMGRHTASYDEYPGVLCNPTGIPDEL